MKERRYFSDENFGRLQTRAHNPDYNVAILYPHYLMAKTLDDVNQLETEINNAVTAIVERNAYENAFLEINPKIESDRCVGLIFNDKTDSFPVLLLHARSTSNNIKTSKPNPSRLAGFQQSAFDIQRHAHQLAAIIWDNRELEWHEIEPLLKNVLNYDFLNNRKI